MDKTRIDSILSWLTSLALMCVGGGCLLPATPAQPTATHTRRIIICVDGVGFSTIQKMRAEGRFKSFREPSRMIAPFPTLTNLALSDILRPAGASAPAGYEDNFFDVNANKMRGGILNRLRGDKFIDGTFRELFDYHPSAIKSGLGYAAPPVSTYVEALSDLVRLRQKARTSREPVFFAYTGATDSLAHLGGEKLVRSFLKQLDESITDIIRDSSAPIEVTIFSDHGNHYRGYRRAKLKSPLKRAGFRLDSRIKDDRSVVIPQFGLVGCAVLFTRESNEARLATALSGVTGVDFIAYETAGIVQLVSRDGAARIERSGGSYRYIIERGDPLGIAATMRELAARGKADADGFIDDADWFAATRAGGRPDAVRRVYDGATAGVGNRANVIVNFADGFYTGSSTLDIFAFLQATHGNLGREQTFGFVMDTRREMPAYVRAGEVWDAIGSPALKKKLCRAPGIKTGTRNDTREPAWTVCARRRFHALPPSRSFCSVSAVNSPLSLS